MAKKAKKAAPAAEGLDIFAALGVDDGNLDPQEPQDEGDEGESPDTKTLEARIEALQRQLDTVTRTNSTLMSPRRAAGEPTSTQKRSLEPQEVSFDGLPDPITDTEGYHKELTRRITASIQQQMAAEAAEREAQMAQQRERDAAAEGLWDEFTEKYPELAEHRDLVEVAAIAVANKAKRRGVDVPTYMFQASEQYIEDVAGEVKRRFGKAIEVLEEKPSGDEDDGEDTSDPRQITQRMNGGRTGGISGGVPTGAPRPKGSDAGSDFIADIHAVQRKLNIF